MIIMLPSLRIPTFRGVSSSISLSKKYTGLRKTCLHTNPLLLAYPNLVRIFLYHETMYPPTNRYVWGYIFGRIKIFVHRLQLTTIDNIPHMKTFRCLSNQITTKKARTLRTHTTNESYTRPLWEPESRKTDYPLGFETSKSATHMTKNLFHMSCLSDIQVSPRSSQDWGRHRREKYGNPNMDNMYFIFMYNKAPTQHFELYGPLSQKSGKRLRETIQFGS